VLCQVGICVVAEKFEAIVKLGMANSHLKDFYHLCSVANLGAANR
jgi:hypothetical protein